MLLRGLHFANLEDTRLEAEARALVSEASFAYYASGADAQWTLADNRAAFARYRLLPRVLQDVSAVDTTCQLFGQRLAFPVLIAPMAMQRLCHPDGERAMARGAATAGTAMIVSTMATCSVEEVAAAAAEGAGLLWFQVYVLTRRDVTKALVQDAEAAGYKAIVVTVDAPRLGNREGDERNQFSLPQGLSLRNLERITAATGGTQHVADDGSKFGRHFSGLIDASLQWDIVPWLKSVTSLPVLVKGILAPDDARRALAAGVDGIIVSNHGGRQLDYSPAAVDMLPHVVRAVAGRVPVLVDGGVRRGTDVLKCLALGATAVLLGRPLLWALALEGQQGVTAALQLLHKEVELGMALLGCPRVSDVTPDFVFAAGPGLRPPEARL